MFGYCGKSIAAIKPPSQTDNLSNQPSINFDEQINIIERMIGPKDWSNSYIHYEEVDKEISILFNKPLIYQLGNLFFESIIMVKRLLGNLI